MSFFKGLWKSSSKHKKLCEEWALANSRECVEGSSGAGTGREDSDDVSEATFTLKYLGSTLVESPSSEEATAEAIKTIITMAKASGKKLPRVSIAISLKGIRIKNLTTDEDHQQISIYRISYCSADATHDHVFAFIATNLNETMECHAFLCPKRKTAQTVTLTVAQAFNTAYEVWQLAQSNPRICHARDRCSTSKEGNNEDETVRQFDRKDEQSEEGKPSKHRNNMNESQKNLLIDLSNDVKPKGNSWVSFEEESSSSTGMKALQKRSPTNCIPMTTLKQTSASTPSHHVVPRPTSGIKVQNAWGESHPTDLVLT